MLHIELKHDSWNHNTWKRLSVGLHDAMSDAQHRSKLESIAFDHLAQYAIDNQMNKGCLAIRIVDKNDVTIFYRRSDADVNSHSD